MTAEARKLQRRISDQLSMPTDYHEWSEAHAMWGVSVCERDYAVVDTVFWVWRCGFTQGQAAKDSCGRPVWFVDVSQRVDCAHWSGKVGTQAQGSKWYAFQIDSVLSCKDSDCHYNK